MSKKQVNFSLISLILSMVIFGTVGVFRRMLPMPSSVIALGRGIVGTLVLVFCIFLRGRKPHYGKGQGVKLFVTGAMIGFNWILLFEAYNHTTVATATLCYYMAPVMVMTLAPLALGEAWSKKKGVCLVLALIGMVLVSGVTEAAFTVQELPGVLMGLGAAALYACVILMNKRIKGVEALDKTALQLGCAAAVLLPYVLLTENVGAMTASAGDWWLLIGMGLVHTGLAYVLYFGALRKVPAHRAAVLSYIDPVVAVLLSALLLNEKMTLWGILGTVLILGAALLGEWPEKTHKQVS